MEKLWMVAMSDAAWGVRRKHLSVREFISLSPSPHSVVYRDEIVIAQFYNIIGDRGRGRRGLPILVMPLGIIPQMQCTLSAYFRAI